MVRIQWTPEKIGALKGLAINGYTDPEVVDMLSRKFDIPMTLDAVKSAKRRYRLTNLLSSANDVKIYCRPRVDEDNYIISCDYHAPYYSVLWVNRLLLLAMKYEIKKHIIVGDLFDMDFAKFFAQMEGEEGSTLDKEIEFSDPLLQTLDYFDETILICGNHETRLGRMTNAKIQFRHIQQIFGQRVNAKSRRFIEYDKLEIGDRWLLVHPKSYSQISGNVAIRLAEKYHRHVLNAHGHFTALRFDRSGEYMAIDLGGMFDVQKISYLNLKTTTHPAWNNGFGMIYQGYFHHFHSGTNWDVLLGGKDEATT